jgi:hypothetical protein
MTKLAKYKKAFTKTVGGNKQLIIGVAIGALITLPTGLYINERVSNSQTPQGGTTTTPQPTDISNNTKTLTPTTVQNGATPSPSQPSGTVSSSGSKPTTYTPSPTYTNTYKASVCTKTPTAYKTNVQLASYLGSNSTRVTGGTNGYTETCTADSTGYVPYTVPLNPDNKNIYVGTGGITATTPPRTTPPDSDQLDRIKTDCGVQLSVHGNQEAYNLCVNTLARYFNIPQ